MSRKTRPLTGHARPRKPAPPRRRFLPRNRLARAGIFLVSLAGYAAAMWYYVFPWVDRNYVNRPGIEGSVAPAGQTTPPSASPTP